MCNGLTALNLITYLNIALTDYANMYRPFRTIKKLFKFYPLVYFGDLSSQTAAKIL